MKQLTILFGFFITLSWILSLGACKHQPWIPDGIEPIDTTGNGGNNGGNNGGGSNTGNPCDPDTVYFEMQILPILQSNCAMSGCHDAGSAQDNVILTDYVNVMNTAEVQPFSLSESELYEVLVETDPDKKMPPPPNTALSNDQISLIAQWINQGALNLTCDANSGCDTTNVSFTNDITPILTNKCTGCHSGGSPSGGVSLDNYNGVKVVAQSGQLYGAVNWDASYSNMPQGGNQLPQCEIDKIKSWVDAGALNN